jgi:hypothetical protein
MVLSAAALVPAVLLPQEVATLPAVLSVFFFVLGFVCCLIMLIRLTQWIFVRHAYFARMPSDKRAVAYEEELRRRGAPEWWIHAGRCRRMAYLTGVIAVASAFVVIRPFPGESHFLLRSIVFLAALVAVILVALRFRTR